MTVIERMLHPSFHFSKNPKVAVVSGVAAISLAAVCAVGAFAMHPSTLPSAFKTKTGQSIAYQHADPKNVVSQSPATNVTATGSTKSTPNTSAPTSTAAAPTGGIHYAVSSDPRSTAYSLTPPVLSSANFNTTITHNGQVAAGTKIAYSAEKGASTYYGGDLIFSPNVIALSRDMLGDHTFSVTIPDGQTSVAPAESYNDLSPVAFISSSAPLSEGTNWLLRVNPNYGYNTAPNGTYQLHLYTVRAGQSSDRWEYDGFLTVTVSGY